MKQDLVAKAMRCSLPALHLIHAHSSRFSHLGGLPVVPSDFQWPEWDGEALGFLAQIDLAEVATALPQPWLPDRGQLYFFYDKRQSTWGFDPTDRGSWRVLYADCERSLLNVPAVPSDVRDFVFPNSSVLPRRIDSLPDWRRLGGIRDLGRERAQKLSDVRDVAFGPAPKHQMFGYPSPLQSDSMELECQLVSNGVYGGTPEGCQTEAAKELVAGASAWRLLLQLDSDEKLGMMWGDVGTLYFWIREQDAVRRDFNNTWFILQCA